MVLIFHFFWNYKFWIFDKYFSANKNELLSSQTYDLASHLQWTGPSVLILVATSELYGEISERELTNIRYIVRVLSQLTNFDALDEELQELQKTCRKQSSRGGAIWIRDQISNMFLERRGL